MSKIKLKMLPNIPASNIEETDEKQFVSAEYITNTGLAIDELTEDSHTHSNKAVLDSLTDVDGDLQYNGEPIKGSGVGGATSKPVYERFVATEGQTVFTLKNPYLPKSNTLDVFVDGVLVSSSSKDSSRNGISDYDYIEVDKNNIRFVNPMQEGRLVVCKTNFLIQRVNTTTTYEYEVGVYDTSTYRVKREIVTGDIEYVTEYFYGDFDNVIEERVTQDGVTKSKFFVYDADNNISSIDNQGANEIIVYRASDKRIFYIDNSNEVVCNHNLGTRFLHVTVWVDDQEFLCNKTILDENNVLISNPDPITGVIIIN